MLEVVVERGFQDVSISLDYLDSSQ